MEKIIILLSAFIAASLQGQIIPQEFGAEKLSAYVDKFNADDDELYVNDFPNSAAKDFLLKNIPLLDTPDETINGVYYFRWWTFRKHIKKTPKGYVITEFLPKVRWSGEFNTISCPAAHHIREGRWLRDSSITADYVRFWSGAKNIRSYSFWYAHSAYVFYNTHKNLGLLKEIYPSLKRNFAEWEKSNRPKKDYLFYIKDGKDGMEVSISGSVNMGWTGYRATINSYMYAECNALSKIAKILGNEDDAKLYAEKADTLKRLINEKLWDKEAKFYKVMPRDGDGEMLTNVRELHGYTPWYFGIAPEEYAEAWKQIADPQGFKGKFGLTSAERRDPRFQINYFGHECQWNGPVWPYSTSITLVALANLLNDYKNHPVSKDDYFDALKTYAASHSRTKENGKKVFWIDENLNPDTGDWISRTRLSKWENGTWYDGKGGKERGKDYNHSTFADLVITGLVGLRVNEDDSISVNPLTPDDWRFFCLENVACKGKNISIFWDEDGSRYNKGKGFFVFVNGKQAARSVKIEKLKIDLSENTQR